jgi:hypothetical protein
MRILYLATGEFLPLAGEPPLPGQVVRQRIQQGIDEARIFETLV